MSQKLLDHSLDLQRLINEGYELEVRNGHALVHHVPYVNSKKEIDYGILVSSLTLNGEATAKPNDHIICFKGDMPCDIDGNVISSIVLDHQEKELGNGIVVQHSFSNKPPQGYSDYYEKFKRYIEIISAPAKVLDNSVRANTFKAWDITSQNIFKYTDTNSSRAGIVAASEILLDYKIAIIGLGGTGSYILDFIAKTPVKEIHLYDGDNFMQHNAFRAPGAPTDQVLDKSVKKVDYFKEIYSNMHKTIISHPCYLNNDNLGEMENMNFIFLSMDSNDEKKDIIDFLIDKHIPFIDTGIGLNCLNKKIGGQIRTTVVGTDIVDRRKIADYIPLDTNDIEDVYKSNIQIAELNALNAIFAVISFKKYVGFYQDQRNESHFVYSIDVGELISDK